MGVLLVGYYGHGNPGDDIALAVVTERLRREKIEYSVLGYGKSAVGVLPHVRAAVSSASAVIFPCGNVLQNETSTRSLLYYLGIIRVAVKIGVPVLFISGGIGKIRGKGLTKITHRALEGAMLFGARTSPDFEFLRGLSIPEKLLIPDPAFLYPTKPRGRRAGIKRIAYIVKRGDSRIQSLLADIRDAVGIPTVIIPLFYDEDFDAARRAAIRLNAPIAVPHGEIELFSMLADASFTVSERLHGGIFSLISGVPAFLPNDNGKCLALKCEISKRAAAHSVPPPIMLFDELSPEKAIELGANSPEFENVLNELRCDTEAGLSYILRRLTHTVGGKD